MALTTVPVELANLDGAVTVNESSADVDFRIESNGNANMLFVNGGSDSVLVGHNTDISLAGESHELQVYDTNFSTISAATFRAGSDGASISLGHSRSGTIGTQTILQDGDTMGAINFMGSDGTDMASYGARIYVEVDGTPGSNDMPGRIKFSTTADGANGSTDRMTIKADGTVGIGTSSPTNVFDTYFTAAAHTSGISISNGQNGGYGSTLAFNSRRSDSPNAIQTAARIRTEGSESWSSDATASSSLVFETRNDNTLAERARFASNGAFLHGKTSTSSNVLGTYIWSYEVIASCADSQNTFLVRSTDSTSYTFYVGGDGEVHSAQGTAMTNLSDERLKENIVDIDTGLTEILALKPRKFDWKEGQGSGKKGLSGFIAQEVEPILPDLIGDFLHDDLEDAKSIRTGDMIPTIVKAMQEQQALIETLEAKVKALEEA